MNTSCDACQAGEWHLHVWDPRDPAAFSSHVEWHCRSWRHEGYCRRWKGAQDFARIVQALMGRIDWTMIVLTFPHAEYHSPWECYKAGVYQWSKLRKRFVEKWGKMEYIQTWEKHKDSDFPHVNLVVGNEKLFAASSKNFQGPRRWVRNAGMACGFGKVLSLKPMYNAAGLAGYISKLSRELTAADKKGQVPVNAPPHFRRIRASRGTLPPVNHGELTGRLVQTSLESWERYALAFCEDDGEIPNEERTEHLDPE